MGAAGDAVGPPEGAGRSFLLIWGGQVVSLLGSQLTTFGLAVWTYQRSGAVTDLSLLFLCASLPGLLLSPLAGVYIDRWDRRRGLILTNLGAACGPLALAVLVLGGHLQIWSLCVINIVYSSFVSFQIPAFAATVTLLVPSRHYARASGLLQLGGSTARLAGPLLGGLLVPAIHLQGLLLLDAVSFLVGILTLLAATIPNPRPTTATTATATTAATAPTTAGAGSTRPRRDVYYRHHCAAGA
jgi:DHA3 family macrolide efflux protein-like MFS transporter